MKIDGIARLAVVLTLAASVWGCRPDDQETATLDPNAGQQARAEMAPELVAQLDSGSAAFRTGHHAAAARHYRRAVEMSPELAAAWFGVYMAEHAMGNMEAADSAFRRAQSLAPGATLIHPTTADTIAGGADGGG